MQVAEQPLPFHILADTDVPEDGAEEAEEDELYD